MSRSIALILLLIALLPAAVGGTGTAPDGLVLITVDSMRADFVGANRAEYGRTPNLDRIAADGVTFTRARSAAPMSLPSLASILTGAYPPIHGLRGDGVSSLPEAQTTLAEALQRRGYRSIAIVSNPALDRRFGLDQGFEVYDDQIGLEPHRIPDLFTRRSSEEVVLTFRSWLNVVEAKQRFFAWIHLAVTPSGSRGIAALAQESSNDTYGEAVAAVDARIGELLAQVSAQGRLERTVIAVVGAHGESLGESGELGHSLLIHPATLHVPMVLRAPGAIAGDKRVENLVRTIDLAPTLLDLFGIENSFGGGVSLMPLLGASSASTWREPSAYSESLFGYYHFGAAPLYGLETPDYRLVSGRSDRLFRVDDRGRESAVEPAEAADRIAEMKVRLRSILRDPGPGRTEIDELWDPHELVAAWIEFQRGAAAVERGEFNIARNHLMAAFAEAPSSSLVLEALGTTLAARGENEEASRWLRRGIAAGVDSAGIRVALARVELQSSRPEVAIRELERAIALDPGDAEARLLLGIAHRSSGRGAAALDSLRQAVQIEPTYLRAWSELGDGLVATGSAAEALRAYRRAVDVAPAVPAARLDLATHLERMGRNAEAIEAYRRFLDLATGPGFDGERRDAQTAIERLGS